jgi:hypothetical protein
LEEQEEEEEEEEGFRSRRSSRRRRRRSEGATGDAGHVGASESRFRAYEEAPGIDSPCLPLLATSLGGREKFSRDTSRETKRQGGASVCMRRHQTSALFR